MKYFFPILVMFILFYACHPVESERPNIIFIMSDDHASKAISAYDNNLMETPNIDRLANQGIRFDRCFCTNAICSPSRAVILTGKYSHINGVLDNTQHFDGSQQTLPKILRENGYQTAMVGKWHLKSEPTGFDYWYVLPGQGHYYRPDFLTPEGRVSVEGYVTDIITDIGIEFLENRDPEKPFFMMLHHKAPHRNWQPAIRHLDIFEDKEFPLPQNLQDNYSGKSRASKEQEMSISRHMSLDYDLKMPENLLDLKGSDRELLFNSDWSNPKNRIPEQEFNRWSDYYTRRAKEYNALPDDDKTIDEWKFRKYMEDYLSCIHTVDENIGRILDYLKETGLDRNTIVIYTSDQGFFLGEHGWYDKRFMYNEAHQMPLIISGPGIKASADKHMITNADFAPTMLALAGIDIPGDMQGTSFLGILEGEEPENWRESVYYHYFEYPAVHSVKRHYGVRTEKYKLIHYYFDIDEWELFDLENDPAEMNNLAGDPDYSAVMQKMKNELQRLQEYYQDTEPEKFLPLSPEPFEHLAKGKAYTLKHQPSERYPGTRGSLTDGFVYPDGEAIAFENNDWCGFQGDDFVINIDLGEEMVINSISVGFLQNQPNWIFLPVKIDFLTSLNGEDYMTITRDLCSGLERSVEVKKVLINTEYSNLETRYITIRAKNSLLPDWHDGAGKPAWIFVDEVIVN